MAVEIKFLQGVNPASQDSHVPMNKESLEKLFAMFEFAVKAMRSMLAGMGVLPKLPGEADAQPQVKPGPDAKVVADTAAQSKRAPAADIKPKVMPAADNKVATDAGVQPKVTAEVRSEEHTSELQSPCNLVCRLLLEKKKKIIKKKKKNKTAGE